MTDTAPLSEQTVALAAMRTQRGRSVLELSRESPVLLVFLRHFGCTFCREAMSDIADQRAELEAAGVRVVLVHMSADELAEQYFERYKLEGIDHVSDPACDGYRAFGLVKGTFNQLFGLQSWIRGFEAGVVKGHWVGYQQLGDGFQMPGAFGVLDGEVVGSFVHKVASDRPDYWALVACCAEVGSVTASAADRVAGNAGTAPLTG